MPIKASKLEIKSVTNCGFIQIHALDGVAIENIMMSVPDPVAGGYKYQAMGLEEALLVALRPYAGSQTATLEQCLALTAALCWTDSSAHKNGDYLRDYMIKCGYAVQVTELGKNPRYTGEQSYKLRHYIAFTGRDHPPDAGTAAKRAITNTWSYEDEQKKDNNEEAKPTARPERSIYSGVRKLRTATGAGIRAVRARRPGFGQ